MSELEQQNGNLIENLKIVGGRVELEMLALEDEQNNSIRNIPDNPVGDNDFVNTIMSFVFKEKDYLDDNAVQAIKKTTNYKIIKCELNVILNIYSQKNFTLFMGIHV